MICEEQQFNNLKYIIYLPEDFDKGKKYPLVILLHGAGTRGTDVELLKRNPCTTRIKEHQNRGYVFAAPLCHAHDWNEIMETLIGWVSELRSRPYIDTDRIYLTGVSMGGYGTWELAILRPEWFAAIMPVCGGGVPAFTKKLINVPVRMFHGLLDNVVDPIESLEMAKALNRFGGHAELILFPDLKHNCWTTVYSTDEHYDWLLGHTIHRKKTDDDLSGEGYRGETYG